LRFRAIAAPFKNRAPGFPYVEEAERLRVAAASILTKAVDAVDPNYDSSLVLL
jgi:hypothetical protein